MFGHLLDATRTTILAASISLLLGLFFTFVWAPHPWTWEGIDQYHDLARALARGEGFRTTDVPWGYAYYLAFFYAVFGERAWLPILFQVIANATMPLMLFAIVEPLAGRRIATLAALILGVFSFNTVYASTQVSDAVCSVVFLAAVWSFFRAHASGSIAGFALSGLLAGIAAQFRPNLLLLPAVVAVVYVAWWFMRLKPDAIGAVRRAGLPAAVLALCSTIPVLPWVVRNYQLAGVFLPTSSHGAIQLWYGTLQVGPYLENFSENPRVAFAPPAFDYTSLVDTPIVVSIDERPCPATTRQGLALTYWTDRQPAPQAMPIEAGEARIPGQPDGTTIYWRIDPAPPEAAPFVYFVSTAHTRDLDRRGDWFDVFDLVRLMLQPGVARGDLERAVRMLIGGDVPVQAFDPSGSDVMLQVYDGSRLWAPKTFTGELTDLHAEPGLARRLLSARQRLAGGQPVTVPAAPECLAGGVKVNDVFYRRELQQMRRYAALAMDNVGREPIAFAIASAYRAIRLFVVRPASGGTATYKFAGADLVYLAGLLLSLTYFLLFLSGVVIAWRQRSPLLAFLVPIGYVPATICFVLTNQRYSVTVQPLMFAFVAVALSWWGRKRV